MSKAIAFNCESFSVGFSNLNWFICLKIIIIFFGILICSVWCSFLEVFFRLLLFLTFYDENISGTLMNDLLKNYGTFYIYIYKVGIIYIFLLFSVIFYEKPQTSWVEKDLGFHTFFFWPLNCVKGHRHDNRLACHGSDHHFMHNLFPTDPLITNKTSNCWSTVETWIWLLVIRLTIVLRMFFGIIISNITELLLLRARG